MYICVYTCIHIHTHMCTHMHTYIYMYACISPGEGKGYLLQYSGLENSMDCIVHAVAKSQSRLSDFHFTSPHIYIYIYTQIFYIYIR